jgi:NAD dependent epimerase/dehydratase family enzyme
MPIGLPAAKWMIEFGAFFLGTEIELIPKSRWVAPKRIWDAGFTFQYPEWPAAAQDLVSRWRAR